MRAHKQHWLLFVPLLVFMAPAGHAESAYAQAAIDLAQRQVTAYLAELADLHCTESVTQEKLASNGHTEATVRARYDYLIMMSGSGNDFQLNESRLESATGRNKPQQLPMLITNGVATILLVFHPYYRDGFTFDIGADEMVNGRPAIPVHFTHIPGRRTPAALVLRGREYDLDLQGTAWLDKDSAQVVKVEASLLRDMSDIGLRSLHILVEYKPAHLSGSLAAVDLPASAIVEVTTPRQRWRNTHVFSDYKSFSTEAEQDPNVKVHAANTNPDGTPAEDASPAGSEEKP